MIDRNQFIFVTCTGFVIENGASKLTKNIKFDPCVIWYSFDTHVIESSTRHHVINLAFEMAWWSRGEIEIVVIEYVPNDVPLTSYESSADHSTLKT